MLLQCSSCLCIFGMILELILHLFQVCPFMYNSDLKRRILFPSISWWTGVCVCVCVVQVWGIMFSLVFSGSEFLLPLNKLIFRTVLPSHPDLLVRTEASHSKQPYPNTLCLLSVCVSSSPYRRFCAIETFLTAQHLLCLKLPASASS